MTVGSEHCVGVMQPVDRPSESIRSSPVQRVGTRRAHRGRIAPSTAISTLQRQLEATNSVFQRLRAQASGSADFAGRLLQHILGRARSAFDLLRHFLLLLLLLGLLLPRPRPSPRPCLLHLELLASLLRLFPLPPRLGLRLVSLLPLALKVLLCLLRFSLLLLKDLAAAGHLLLGSADLRIAAITIDGNSGTLAYNLVTPVYHLIAANIRADLDPLRDLDLTEEYVTIDFPDETAKLIHDRPGERAVLVQLSGSKLWRFLQANSASNAAHDFLLPEQLATSW